MFMGSEINSYLESLQKQAIILINSTITVCYLYNNGGRMFYGNFMVKRLISVTLSTTPITLKGVMGVVEGAPASLLLNLT